MKKIELSKQGKKRGLFSALVDDEDYEYLNQWNWYVWKCGNTYYAVRRERKPDKFILMHRVILNTPDGVDVDHSDRNGLNNLRSNIRNCTNSQNQWNKEGWGMSGFKGVYKREYKGKIKYRAMIQINKIATHLGYFATAEKAAIAYDKKAKEVFKEFALTNF